jgi:nucleoside-diphosphate-sugar epimerase
MRIFVTGASGWIGSAVIPELTAAGHQAVGLARSDTAAAAIEAAGGEVSRGDLVDLAALATATAESDGVIHLAFRHDLAFSGAYAAAVAVDLAVIEALASVLTGTDKPLVIASGILGLAHGRIATEHDVPDPATSPRAASEHAALALAERGIRSSSVRLAPTVHGEGDTGFVPALIGIARETGVSGYVGDGANRWPAVHRLDAARLFRLAAESAPAGSVLHGTADVGVPLHDIATVIGRHLGLPTASIAPDDADAHFRWMSRFVAFDSPASSDSTQELIGWRPAHQGLLTDLEEGHYFTL